MTTSFRWKPVSGLWYDLDGQLENQAVSAHNPAVNDVYYCPFWGKRGLTIDQLAYEITTQGVSASGTDEMRFGVYASHVDTGMPDALVVDFGKIDLEATIGVKTFDVTNTAMPPGLLWMAACRQQTGSIGTPGQVRGLVGATSARTLFGESGGPTMGSGNFIGRYAYNAIPVSGAFPANASVAVGGIGTAMTWIKYKAL